MGHRPCTRQSCSERSPRARLAALPPKQKALSALAVVILMQALKHSPFRAPKGSYHLHRMGFASLYTILRKLVRTTWRCAGRRKLEQPPTPLQEAERSRCAGGRAAWMPREARQAMDGPSRRPPEQRWSEGTKAKPGPDDGASFWFLFNDWKRDSPGGAKPETSSELGNQLGSNLLATLNADRAKQNARLPLCCCSIESAKVSDCRGTFRRTHDRFGLGRSSASVSPDRVCISHDDDEMSEPC